MRSASRGLASRRSPSARSTHSAEPSLLATFRGSRSMTMSAPLTPGASISSSAGRPAKAPASLPRSMVVATAAVSGRTCFISDCSVALNGLSWSSRRGMNRGRLKSVVVFPTLAAMSPDLSSALAMLVRRIFAGGCSWLPAPACRDWRSPGARSHPRLSKSRGQQMPEVIGTRISSQLYEWMLALPERWSDPRAGSVSSA